MIVTASAAEDSVRWIAENLREWDYREFAATMEVVEPVDFAELVVRTAEQAWVVSKDSEPVVAVGAHVLWPGVASVWAFGTDRFGEVGIEATRVAVRRVTPDLIGKGVHRAECKTIEGHHAAHRWLERIGLHREAEHPMYGRNGETFYTYARLHRA